MHFEIKKEYHGFTLLQEREIRELNSRGRLFVHEKSGARLFSLRNDDPNKVFSITFRTPPQNSTGMPHILEHSVLCGSRKFPSKEPFVELAKGSLNTFLNAMTFPDKTMYPVASKNEKDFFNLMDVYLDAVFYPNVYKHPEIFLQEGWHYELHAPEDDLEYKGVVYNEMLGAFSTPETLLFRKIQQSLFPDSPYGFDSGGDPEVIPQLSLDQFLSFHERYYHPSNGYIYLYGNGELAEQLGFLNTHYLKDFHKMEIESDIRVQDSFPRLKEVAAEYPLSPAESEKDKTYLSLNFVVDRSINPELYLAFKIMGYMLLESPAAPVKRALIDAELGKDVFGGYEGSIMQPFFTIVLKNSNPDQKDRFKEMVFENLESLVRRGIDKRLIEASINTFEFRIREADFRSLPKGLVYNVMAMDSWLYGGNPFLHLEYEPSLEKIKTALTTGYFEELIEHHLLKNSHCSLFMLTPKRKLAEKKAEQIKARLSDYKASLSEDDLEALVKKTQELKKRQMTPDSKQDLAKIPLLSLRDIDPKIEKLPQEEQVEGGIKVLAHPMFTSKIAYLNLYFDTTRVPQQDLPYISLFARLLGKISTEKYGYEELSNTIDIHTGGIDFSTQTLGHKEDHRIYYPKLMVKTKALVHKLPRLAELLSEILGHTRYDERKRIKELIQETKSRLEMNIFDQGHAVVARRLFSYFSPIGKYVELTEGLFFYHFIVELERNYASMASFIEEKLIGLARLIFDRNNLLVSITTAEEDYKDFQKCLPVLLEHLRNDKVERTSYSFDFSQRNEGFLTPGKVQYVAKGYNFCQLGYQYAGDIEVLRTIMGLDYLWNRIRVQGGAYGSFARFSRNGNCFFGSYRDPNLIETLVIYNEAASYVRGFEADEREMTKYVVGTIGRLDSPLTPSMKGEISAARYISSITDEDIQEERDAILSARKSNIKRYADLIQEVMDKNYVCVLGNEGKLKENREVFDSLIPLFSPDAKGTEK